MDEKAIGYLHGRAAKPHPEYGVCMRENNWEYALDCSATIGNFCADANGESYLSYWERGLGVTHDGKELPEWRSQVGLPPWPADLVELLLTGTPNKAGATMTSILSNLHKLAYQGKWDEILAILRLHPEWVNEGSDGKAYTALHQAAWHGASLVVIGELLALGADRSLRTANKRQTAADIAADKHPSRHDLAYLLRDTPRTAAQLLRKAHADDAGMFGSYDGDQIMFDRVVESLGADLLGTSVEVFSARLTDAYQAVGGVNIGHEAPHTFVLSPHYDFEVEPPVWRVQIPTRFANLASKANAVPLERSWTVIGDLFLPLPEKAGGRGDLFLKVEMLQAFCHVHLPDDCDTLRRMLDAMFLALTGVEVTSRTSIFIKRFARGGMSSGVVSPETWDREIFPAILQRAEWLQQSWQWERR